VHAYSAPQVPASTGTAGAPAHPHPGLREQRGRHAAARARADDDRVAVNGHAVVLGLRARMRSEGRPGPGNISARAGPGRRRGRRCVAARRRPAGPPGLRIRAVSAPRRWRSGHRRATLCISCIDRLRVGPARAWVACSRGGRGRASTTRRPCANSMAASCPVLRQTAVAMSSVAPSSAASLASLAALGCAGRAGSAPARSPGVMPVAWADSELLPSTLG